MKKLFDKRKVSAQTEDRLSDFDASSDLYRTKITNVVENK